MFGGATAGYSLDCAASFGCEVAAGVGMAEMPETAV